MSVGAGRELMFSVGDRVGSLRDEEEEEAERVVGVGLLMDEDEGGERGKEEACLGLLIGGDG